MKPDDELLEEASIAEDDLVNNLAFQRKSSKFTMQSYKKVPTFKQKVKDADDNYDNLTSPDQKLKQLSSQQSGSKLGVTDTFESASHDPMYSGEYTIDNQSNVSR